MTRGLEIDCQDLVELVTDYLEGVVSDDDRHQFGEHLELCDGCDAYLDQISQTVRLTGQFSEDRIAPEIRDRLLSVLRDWKSGRRRPVPGPT